MRPPSPAPASNLAGPLPLRDLVDSVRHHLRVIRDLLGEAPARSASLEEARHHVQPIRFASEALGHRCFGRLVSRLETELRSAAERRALDAAEREPLERLVDDLQMALGACSTLTQRMERARLREDDSAHEEIREIFRLEAGEHIEALAALFSDLERRPGATELVGEIRRRAHSLKGGAGTAGFPVISTVAHGMEDYLEGAIRDETSLDVDLLLRSTDVIQRLVDEGEDDEAVEGLLALYEERGCAPASSPAASGEAGTGPSSASASRSASASASASRSASASVIRIPVSRHDELVRLVAGLIANRGTLELDAGRLVAGIEEGDGIVARLERVAAFLEDHTQADPTGWLPSAPAVGPPRRFSGADESGDGSFDALELERYTERDLMARALTEAVSDLRTLTLDLRSIRNRVKADLGREAELSRELESRLFESRRVRFATLIPRLERAARWTARRLGKEVDVRVEGAAVEIDKVLQEALRDPLIHLLRNAVDHGIESPRQRLRAGKAERGRVDIRVSQEGRTTVLRVEDDGRGLDAEAIGTTARLKGLVTRAELERMDEDEVYAFLFRPGFSTALQVDEVSGRGVGLDVVAELVQQRDGSLRVDSRPGEGAAFELRLPMRLATERVLLVEAAGRTYAIPQVYVERVTVAGETRETEEADSLPSLARLLGLANGEPPAFGPGLVLRQAPDRGLRVDALHRSRDVVVRPLGSHLRRVPGVSGVTTLGDRRLIPVLNPLELVLAEDGETVRDGTGRRRSGRVLDVARRGPGPRPSPGLHVLIVDDSLSVRRALERTVRQNGWHSTTARDGQEALEILQRGVVRPDVILLDIEMPRMDGYELTATLRSVESLRHIPIVMLTSRAGDKHRQRALAVGVQDYVVKPYQEEELVGILRRVGHRLA